jgi:hypothetical protein
VEGKHLGEIPHLKATARCPHPAGSKTYQWRELSILVTNLDIAIHRIQPELKSDIGRIQR